MTSMAMLFSKSPDGQVRLEDHQWAKEIEVSGELLEQGRGDLLETNGEFIRFTVANGSALYSITGEWPGTGVAVEPSLRIVSARLLESDGPTSR